MQVTLQGRVLATEGLVGSLEDASDACIKGWVSTGCAIVRKMMPSSRTSVPRRQPVPLWHCQRCLQHGSSGLRNRHLMLLHYYRCSM